MLDVAELKQLIDSLVCVGRSQLLVHKAARTLVFAGTWNNIYVFVALYDIIDHYEVFLVDQVKTLLMMFVTFVTHY